MSILAFLVIGLLAGLIARALLPGNQSMGLIATMLIGIAGSFVGGFIGSFFRSDGRMWDLHPSGLIFSVIGAMLVLFLVGLAGRSRRVRV
ncbi:MAG: GlsB/YeaQ/YmgE family stress response membrane protein [Myxococcaceae bacterium]|nr:GlsB/YeaQ/YmgE family stress response membrane protein [Myxococcaceae bacterium]